MIIFRTDGDLFVSAICSLTIYAIIVIVNNGLCFRLNSDLIKISTNRISRADELSKAY